MKTIREHLDSLPEPHRSQALVNLDRDYPAIGEKQRLTASAAILDAFPWAESPEGHYYWLGLYTDLTNSGR